MNIRLTREAILLETVKNKDHFALVYPRTPLGRLAAKQAVRSWLLDCELDFNGQDAVQFCKAIDGQWLSGRCDRPTEGGARWDVRRRA